MNCCFSVKNCELRNGNVRKIVRVLKVLGYLQVLVCLYTFVVSLASGVIMGIACFALFFVLAVKTWEACVFYILGCLVDFYFSFLFVLRVVVESMEFGGSFRVMKVVYLVKFPVCLLCGFYCFLLYKELKAEAIEEASEVIVVTNYGANENRSGFNEDLEYFRGDSYRI